MNRAAVAIWRERRTALAAPLGRPACLPAAGPCATPPVHGTCMICVWCACLVRAWTCVVRDRRGAWCMANGTVASSGRRPPSIVALQSTWCRVSSSPCSSRKYTRRLAERARGATQTVPTTASGMPETQRTETADPYAEWRPNSQTPSLAVPSLSLLAASIIHGY